MGLYVHVHERLRLAGIDAWEVRGPERPQGLVGKVALEAIFSENPNILVRTIKDGRGKYGRFLAHIYTVDPETEEVGLYINDWLVDQGHAEWAEY